MSNRLKVLYFTTLFLNIPISTRFALTLKPFHLKHLYKSNFPLVDTKKRYLGMLTQNLLYASKTTPIIFSSLSHFYRLKNLNHPTQTFITVIHSLSQLVKHNGYIRVLYHSCAKTGNHVWNVKSISNSTVQS